MGTTRVRERTQAILGELREVGQVSTAALAVRFSVSEMTVRRDLAELERRGLCHRTHGGALLTPRSAWEPPYYLRERTNAEVKQRLGKAAADALSEGESVYVDVGTTALEVARALRGRRNFTVVTPSLRVATTLADEEHIRTILTGGVVRNGEHSLVGSLTERVLRELTVDVAVLGVGGLTGDAGLSEFNLDDAGVKRVAIERAARVIVVADASKLGRGALSIVAPLSRVDLLVCDADPSDPSLLALAQQGVEVRSV